MFGDRSSGGHEFDHSADRLRDTFEIRSTMLKKVGYAIQLKIQPSLDYTQEPL